MTRLRNVVGFALAVVGIAVITCPSVRARGEIPFSVNPTSDKQQTNGFSIEDKTLTSPPDYVQSAVHKDQRFIRGQHFSLTATHHSSKARETNNCDLVGERISLAPNIVKSFFVVTTRGDCGGGAASGPIWVVKANKDNAEILLSDNGYRLLMERKLHNGLRDIVISIDTAGHTERTVWKFDGKKFVTTSVRESNDQDKESKGKKKN